MSKLTLATVTNITSLIRTIRGQRVILDFDMARIYGVPTFRFNEAVKRNSDRFPSDFLFQLTTAEAKSLRSQSATLKQSGNPSQIAIGSQKHRDPRLRPYAFTEKGVTIHPHIATMEADPTKAYDQGDATGFIRLNALQLKVAAKVQRKKK